MITLITSAFDLDCQKVLPFEKLEGGKIPENLTIGKLNIPENVIKPVTRDFFAF